ncbi:MAG: AtpZ/AtpI family protein [Rhodospirillaceae bacterium]|nr:AtpZ/AtpI family protein [Rhodospirillaceae bacterium]
MAQQDRPPSLDRLDARLRAAQKRRDANRAGRGGRRDAEDRTDRGKGIGLALRIGTELVAGVAVGVAIGLGLDWWLGTKPWLMIVFFFLGAGAGIVNVYRTMSGLGHAVGYADRDRAKNGGGPGPDERKGE